MKILVVTARKARPIVEQTIGDFTNVHVETLNLDIAAFTTPKLLREALADEKHNYDLILVSGLCGADFSKLERDLGVKIRLGPKHASDLSVILKYADKIEFSSKIPACMLLSELIKKDALQKVETLEKKADCKFQVRDLKIGGSCRMKVLAEIVDATRLENTALLKRARYYIVEGADMIDLGVHLEASAEDVERAVKLVMPLGVPVSIDTLEGELIKAGVRAGADMVLSLNSINLKKSGREIADSGAAAVIIPDGDDLNLSSLLSNIEQVKAKGIKKIIADPILNPVAHGCVDSIARYGQFRALDRDTPLFFGTGNVTELLDADPAGANALLAGLAMELKASILFTPEHSDKAKGSVRELRTASEMMLLAKERQTPPKDLGIDLLRINEKRARQSLLEVKGDIIRAEPTKIWKLDPKGCFKIGIVELDGENIIVAVQEPGKLAIKGKTAKEIIDTILKQQLISTPEHAAYLGRELMKAELALKFGRSYSQDDEF